MLYHFTFTLVYTKKNIYIYINKGRINWSMKPKCAWKEITRSQRSWSCFTDFQKDPAAQTPLLDNNEISKHPSEPFNSKSDTKLQAEQRTQNINEHILERTKGFCFLNNFSFYPQMSLSQMRSNAFLKLLRSQRNVHGSLLLLPCEHSHAALHLHYRTDLCHAMLSVYVIIIGAVSRSALCHCLSVKSQH